MIQFGYRLVLDYLCETLRFALPGRNRVLPSPLQLLVLSWPKPRSKRLPWGPNPLAHPQTSCDAQERLDWRVILPG